MLANLTRAVGQQARQLMSAQNLDVLEGHLWIPGETA